MEAQGSQEAEVEAEAEAEADVNEPETAEPAQEMPVDDDAN